MYAYYFIVVLTEMPRKTMTTAVHTPIPFFFDSFVFFLFSFLSCTIITIIIIIIIIHIRIHRPTGLHVLYLRPTYWRTPENPSHRNGTVALTGFLILSSTRSTTRQQICITSISNTRPIALNSYHTHTFNNLYIYSTHTHTRTSHVIRIMCSTSL